MRFLSDEVVDEPRTLGLRFYKMHSLGNDFVILDSREVLIELPEPEDFKVLADRRRGIGFDQLIEIGEYDGEADVELTFHNADGSEADACGNGTRCAANLLMPEVDTKTILIHTAGGTVECEPVGENEIRMDIGRPKFDWQEIPLAHAVDTLHFPPPEALHDSVPTMAAVSMGNPHCVMFVDDLVSFPLATVGPELETHELFPERANVSVAQVLSPKHIKLRVWERGTGLTLACGSAACAVAATAIRRGLCERAVDMEFEHGSLRVEWPDDGAGMLLTGPVVRLFHGQFDPDFWGLRESEFVERIDDTLWNRDRPDRGRIYDDDD